MPKSQDWVRVKAPPRRGARKSVEVASTLAAWAGSVPYPPSTVETLQMCSAAWLRPVGACTAREERSAGSRCGEAPCVLRAPGMLLDWARVGAEQITGCHGACVERSGCFCMGVACCTLPYRWSRCGDGSATSSIAAVLLPHVRLSHVAVMAGCDWVGSGSETVGDGGHLQPPSCHCGPLERAPEGGQALFGVPIILCRLFSGKLSLLFIEIHCVKILRFVSRWTEKRVFCGKTFDYGVPIP